MKSKRKNVFGVQLEFGNGFENTSEEEIAVAK